MRFIELNHPIKDGMRPYPGLPVPRITAFFDHLQSRSSYDNKAEFYLGMVEMPCNVGTYLASPFHRHSRMADLSQLPLEMAAGLPGIVLDGYLSEDCSITIECSDNELGGRAVLIRTGWDGRWGTDSYWEPGPYLSAGSIDLLVRSKAALVGVDFWNVDDTADPVRPVHTRLLASDILIVEHLCNLYALPESGFRFYAVPPRIVSGASFPVRAFAELDEKSPRYLYIRGTANLWWGDLMLFQRIESRGLAHYSYLIGDAGEAVVIDPRRDCDVYIKRTYPQGYRIAHILETHRNEDYVTGSVELAARTGAAVWHADPQWDYRYGRAVEDGQTWTVGRLTIRAIHSPGHTPGSMSYLLHDADGYPWMLFSGDTLFAGDVGRVDLMGMDRAGEMAGLLYDTLFNNLLPLGDGVLVCPAHGAGSICGTAIADRPWTTIGLERRHNPGLQFTDRDQFISNYAVQLEYPPYFRQMETLNLEGRQGSLPTPPPLSPEEFAAQKALVLDTRTELGFGAAHVPGALSIWLEGLSGFAGWFLDYNIHILLITDDPSQSVRYLFRLGYDSVAGYLSGGMHTWHTAGMESSSISMVTVHALCRHLDENGPAWILDVRSKKELISRGMISGAHHIHITQLPGNLDEVPRDLPVYIFCGSGLRSMIAASLLKRSGWTDLRVVLGGITGWNSITCPIK